MRRRGKQKRGSTLPGHRCAGASTEASRDRYSTPLLDGQPTGPSPPVRGAHSSILATGVAHPAANLSSTPLITETNRHPIQRELFGELKSSQSLPSTDRLRCADVQKSDQYTKSTEYAREFEANCLSMPRKISKRELKALLKQSKRMRPATSSDHECKASDGLLAEMDQLAQILSNTCLADALTKSFTDAGTINHSQLSSPAAHLSPRGIGRPPGRRRGIGRARGTVAGVAGRGRSSSTSSASSLLPTKSVASSHSSPGLSRQQPLLTAWLPYLTTPTVSPGRARSGQVTNGAPWLHRLSEVHVQRFLSRLRALLPSPSSSPMASLIRSPDRGGATAAGSTEMHQSPTRLPGSGITGLPVLPAISSDHRTTNLSNSSINTTKQQQFPSDLDMTKSADAGQTPWSSQQLAPAAGLRGGSGGAFHHRGRARIRGGRRRRRGGGGGGFTFGRGGSQTGANSSWFAAAQEPVAKAGRGQGAVKPRRASRELRGLVTWDAVLEEQRWQQQQLLLREQSGTEDLPAGSGTVAMATRTPVEVTGRASVVESVSTARSTRRSRQMSGGGLVSNTETAEETSSGACIAPTAPNPPAAEAQPDWPRLTSTAQYSPISVEHDNSDEEGGVATPTRQTSSSTAVSRRRALEVAVSPRPSSAQVSPIAVASLPGKRRRSSCATTMASIGSTGLPSPPTAMPSVGAPVDSPSTVVGHLVTRRSTSAGTASPRTSSSRAPTLPPRKRYKVGIEASSAGVDPDASGSCAVPLSGATPSSSVVVGGVALVGGHSAGVDASSTSPRLDEVQLQQTTSASSATFGLSMSSALGPTVLPPVVKRGRGRPPRHARYRGGRPSRLDGLSDREVGPLSSTTSPKVVPPTAPGLIPAPATTMERPKREAAVIGFASLVAANLNSSSLASSSASPTTATTTTTVLPTSTDVESESTPVATASEALPTPVSTPAGQAVVVRRVRGRPRGSGPKQVAAAAAAAAALAARSSSLKRAPSSDVLVVEESVKGASDESSPVTDSRLVTTTNTSPDGQTSATPSRRRKLPNCATVPKTTTTTDEVVSSVRDENLTVCLEEEEDGQTSAVELASKAGDDKRSLNITSSSSSKKRKRRGSATAPRDNEPIRAWPVRRGDSAAVHPPFGTDSLFPDDVDRTVTGLDALPSRASLFRGSALDDPVFQTTIDRLSSLKAPLSDILLRLLNEPDPEEPTRRLVYPILFLPSPSRYPEFYRHLLSLRQSGLHLHLSQSGLLTHLFTEEKTNEDETPVDGGPLLHSLEFPSLCLASLADRFLAEKESSSSSSLLDKNFQRLLRELSSDASDGVVVVEPVMDVSADIATTLPLLDAAVETLLVVWEGYAGRRSWLGRRLVRLRSFYASLRTDSTRTIAVKYNVPVPPLKSTALLNPITGGGSRSTGLGKKRKTDRRAMERGAEVIRCLCGFRVEGGHVMVQCDCCAAWQHLPCLWWALRQSIARPGHPIAGARREEVVRLCRATLAAAHVAGSGYLADVVYSTAATGGGGGGCAGGQSLSPGAGGAGKMASAGGDVANGEPPYFCTVCLGLDRLIKDYPRSLSAAMALNDLEAVVSLQQTTVDGEHEFWSLTSTDGRQRQIRTDDYAFVHRRWLTYSPLSPVWKGITALGQPWTAPRDDLNTTLLPGHVLPAAERPYDLVIIRIYRLWKDNSGKAWFEGGLFLRPYDLPGFHQPTRTTTSDANNNSITTQPPSRLWHPRDVVYDEASRLVLPLAAWSGQCCVLSPSAFRTGRPADLLTFNDARSMLSLSAGSSGADTPRVFVCDKLFERLPNCCLSASSPTGVDAGGDQEAVAVGTGRQEFHCRFDEISPGYLKVNMKPYCFLRHPEAGTLTGGRPHSLQRQLTADQVWQLDQQPFSSAISSPLDLEPTVGRLTEETMLPVDSLNGSTSTNATTTTTTATPSSGPAVTGQKGALLARVVDWLERKRQAVDSQPCTSSASDDSQHRESPPPHAVTQITPAVSPPPPLSRSPRGLVRRGRGRGPHQQQQRSQPPGTDDLGEQASPTQQLSIPTVAEAASQRKRKRAQPAAVRKSSPPGEKGLPGGDNCRPVVKDSDDRVEVEQCASPPAEEQQARTDGIDPTPLGCAQRDTAQVMEGATATTTDGDCQSIGEPRLLAVQVSSRLCQSVRNVTVTTIREVDCPEQQVGLSSLSSTNRTASNPANAWKEEVEEGGCSVGDQATLVCPNSSPTSIPESAQRGEDLSSSSPLTRTTPSRASSKSPSSLTAGDDQEGKRSPSLSRTPLAGMSSSAPDPPAQLSASSLSSSVHKDVQEEEQPLSTSSTSKTTPSRPSGSDPERPVELCAESLYSPVPADIQEDEQHIPISSISKTTPILSSSDPDPPAQRCASSLSSPAPEDVQEEEQPLSTSSMSKTTPSRPSVSNPERPVELCAESLYSPVPADVQEDEQHIPISSISKTTPILSSSDPDPPAQRCASSLSSPIPADVQEEEQSLSTSSMSRTTQSVPSGSDLDHPLELCAESFHYSAPQDVQKEEASLSTSHVSSSYPRPSVELHAESLPSSMLVDAQEEEGAVLQDVLKEHPASPLPIVPYDSPISSASPMDDAQPEENRGDLESSITLPHAMETTDNTEKVSGCMKSTELDDLATSGQGDAGDDRVNSASSSSSSSTSLSPSSSAVSTSATPTQEERIVSRTSHDHHQLSRSAENSSQHSADRHSHQHYRRPTCSPQAHRRCSPLPVDEHLHHRQGHYRRHGHDHHHRRHHEPSRWDSPSTGRHRSSRRSPASRDSEHRRQHKHHYQDRDRSRHRHRHGNRSDSNSSGSSSQRRSGYDHHQQQQQRYYHPQQQPRYRVGDSHGHSRYDRSRTPKPLSDGDRYRGIAGFEPTSGSGGGNNNGVGGSAKQFFSSFRRDSP